MVHYRLYFKEFLKKLKSFEVVFPTDQFYLRCVELSPRQAFWLYNTVFKKKINSKHLFFLNKRNNNVLKSDEF